MGIITKCTHLAEIYAYAFKSLLINCLISLIIEVGIMLKTKVEELNYLSYLFGIAKSKIVSEILIR